MSVGLDRDALAREAMPLVSHCVASIAARIPRHVRRDELVSAGLLGLAQAALAWDPERGVPFEHYARQRISGALLDELRGRDWASRSVRSDARRLHAATDELTARLGRSPADEEIAAALGVTGADVARIRDDVERSVVMPLEALRPDGGADSMASHRMADDPAHQVMGRELEGYVRDAVLVLPDRLRKIMVEYFFDERPMQDIADDLGVTVSRVSQLRAQAIQLMREGIAAQFETEDAVGPAPASSSGRKRARYAAAIAACSSPADRLSSTAPRMAERLLHAG